MPCGDGMPRTYDPSDVADIEKRAYERGYKEAVTEFDEKLRDISDKTKIVTAEYREFETAMCALLRRLSADADCVETVLSDLNVPAKAKKTLLRFWETHQKQDRLRVKQYMSSWDSTDKEIALALLKEEMSNDD
ncbi:hypothetical protein A5gp_00055 [Alteromonas phage vB_AemP_PT15-A5]|nr:hypothetical protein A5gp_00055 [Alteromonas phage vB_AemP_PT15-A5]